MRLILLSILAIAVLGLAVAVVFPEFGLDVGDYSNAVRGLYTQKNTFGIALLEATLALSFLVLEHARFRVVDGLIIGTLLFILVLTRSTTSLLLSLLVSAATAWLVLVTHRGAWRIIGVLVAIAAVVGGVIMVSVLGVNGLFDLIGKDSTLTGRTEIWRGVWVAISHRPLLGYGYSAFWLPDSREMMGIWAEAGWTVRVAHSGYLDVRLQLGSLGIGGVILLSASSLLYVVLGLFGPLPRRAVWLLVFLFIHAVLDRTESGLFSPDLRHVLWIVGVLAASAPLRTHEGLRLAARLRQWRTR